jgi:hypothetical protein
MSRIKILSNLDLLLLLCYWLTCLRSSIELLGGADMAHNPDSGNFLAPVFVSLPLICRSIWPFMYNARFSLPHDLVVWSRPLSHGHVAITLMNFSDWFDLNPNHIMFNYALNWCLVDVLLLIRFMYDCGILCMCTSYFILKLLSEIQLGSHVHMLPILKNYISECQKIQTKNFTCTSS